jgi:hypothetical protein
MTSDDRPLRRVRPSAPAWADVKLRCTTGALPEPGTELVTFSGRRYQVLRIRGKTLHCIVLPPDAALGDPIWRWTWDAVNKRREP